MNSTLARYWTRPLADVRDLFIVDLFAGGGGASDGIRRALGRCPDIAINHDPAAVEMHTVNHPSTRHYCEDVFHVDPRQACGARRPDLLWASPDCTFHSRARGCAPIRDADRPIRGLAWVVVRDPLDEDGRGEDRHPGWADTVRPKVICLENVPEFAKWGPLLEDGRPDPARSGETFRRFVGALEALGYAVEWRTRKAHHAGAPTSRERLYLVARCDGQPIVWPEPTHGPGRLPFRTAAECIDWTIPCPSVLLTQEQARQLKAETGIECRRPLADATLRRVAEGVRRYVVESASPYIVRTDMQSGGRLRGLAPTTEPLRTVTTGGGHALATPHIVNITHGGRLESADQPLRTITCAAGGEKMVAVPMVVTTRNGERDGQRPRVGPADQPAGTITAHGSQGALGVATLTKFYGTAHAADVAEPLDTVTTLDRFGCVVGSLTKFYGSAQAGAPLDAPAPTVTTGGGKGGGHVGLVAGHVVKHNGGVIGHEMERTLGALTAVDSHGVVAAHLAKHYSNQHFTPRPGQDLREPIGAITATDHHGPIVSELRTPPLDEATAARARRLAELLVHHCPALATHVGAHGMITCTIGGEEYVLVDVGLRMLAPRELATAQGFGPDYVLTGTRRSQIERIGNSVVPHEAAAIVGAQFGEIARAAA